MPARDWALARSSLGERRVDRISRARRSPLALAPLCSRGCEIRFATTSHWNDLVRYCNSHYNSDVTKLKIRSIGTSYGVILPKEMLDRLNLSEGDELFAVEIGGQLRLSPYNPDFEKAMDAAKDIVKRYRNALRAMAKS